MNIFTGSYESCKPGNLVSISGDKGASANFVGPSYLKLAPFLCMETQYYLIKRRKQPVLYEGVLCKSTI